MAFEKKEYSDNVLQAFDKVWRERLLYKIKSTLPGTYFIVIN